MEMVNQTISRTFDLLNRYKGDLADMPVAFSGKEGGKWQSYTPKEYLDYTNLVSYGFLSLGIKKGEKVATVMNNRPEWNFFDMGLAQIGAVHVPIYPTISIDDYKYILNHCEAKYVIVGDKKLFGKIGQLVDSLEFLDGIYSVDEIDGVKNWRDLVALGEAFTEKGILDGIKDSILVDDIATLIYTSGTTGVPKGVMLSHRNLVENFKLHSQCHNIRKGGRALSFLPLCHVFERSLNYHYQYDGLAIYYVGNLGHIMSALKEVKPHIFCTVPRLLERIYDGIMNKGQEQTGVKKLIYKWAVSLGKNFDYKKKRSFLYNWQRKIADKLVYSKWRDVIGGDIQVIVSGGAALQPRICRIFGVAGVRAIEGYGLTETSPVIAVNSPANDDIKIGTVGLILSNVDVKFAEDGEILCKSPSVMVGYYKEPELTRNVIDEDGYFHTGDIGTLVDGKYLKITDRKKEIFKLSGGKYIAPQMIENKLKESLFIEQSMVVGENEKFASALIVPDFVYIATWMKQQGLDCEISHDEVIKHPDVIAAINKEVAAINKTLGQVEEIKRHKLVPDQWSAESGELSSTQKLKRNFVAAKYGKEINEIFAIDREERENESATLGSIKQRIEPLRRYINLSLPELISRLKSYGSNIKLW